MELRPRPGDYWRRVWEGIVIYGYAQTLDEIREGEVRLGADASEVAYTLRVMKRQMNSGFIWGKAYSQVVPEGEYGLTPARQAVRITKEEFENARRAEWTA